MCILFNCCCQMPWSMQLHIHLLELRLHGDASFALFKFFLLCLPHFLHVLRPIRCSRCDWLCHAFFTRRITINLIIMFRRYLILAFHDGLAAILRSNQAHSAGRHNNAREWRVAHALFLRSADSCLPGSTRRGVFGRAKVEVQSMERSGAGAERCGTERSTR